MSWKPFMLWFFLIIIILSFPVHGAPGRHLFTFIWSWDLNSRGWVWFSSRPGPASRSTCVSSHRPCICTRPVIWTTACCGRVTRVEIIVRVARHGISPSEVDITSSSNLQAWSSKIVQYVPDGGNTLHELFVWCEVLEFQEFNRKMKERECSSFLD